MPWKWRSYGDQRRKYQHVNAYWKKVYYSIYKKIADRRTGWTTKGRFVEHEIFGWRDLSRDLATRRLYGQCDYLVPVDPHEAEGENYYQSFERAHLPLEPHIPLEPYSNFPSPGKAHYKAVQRKYSKLQTKGMKWETIIHSVTPEFKLGTEPSNFYNKRPRGTDWYTWAPYLKEKRKGKARRTPVKKAEIQVQLPLKRNNLKITKYSY